MSIVYLNGQYLPMEEAKISPMDRGFLFGDGIYEVVPSYAGKMVGFLPHIQRMQDGLKSIGIELDWHADQWREVATQLMEKNGKGNLGLYFHVSRGADDKRMHAFPQGVTPTVFAFAFEIAMPATQPADAKRYKVSTNVDMRWRRCHIKSTSLLGNVMHYQQGKEQGMDEIILLNQQDEVTEASSSNVFIVKDGIIVTPVLDNQLLPGITRFMILDILAKYSNLVVEQRVISRQELEQADEIWVTSSSKEIAPVVELDGKPVADGQPGNVWLEAISLYAEHKYKY